ncbi:MAG: hypothetical protein IIB17_06715, partial [Chloroflexi bacterium]|nr:hypothetical protein [Chloroflexota bacterium]
MPSGYFRCSSKKTWTCPSFKSTFPRASGGPPGRRRFCRSARGSLDFAEYGGAASKPSDGGGPQLGFIKVPEGKTVKRRLHLDIQPVRVTMEAEVQRLVELGASRVEISDGPSGTWTVMADPARNEFCMTKPASIQ